MRVYKVYEPSDMDAPGYFRTKAEALTFAHGGLADLVYVDEEIEIICCEVVELAKLPLLLLILNGEGWATKQTVVTTVPERLPRSKW